MLQIIKHCNNWWLEFKSIMMLLINCQGTVNMKKLFSFRPWDFDKFFNTKMSLSWLELLSQFWLILITPPPCCCHPLQFWVRQSNLCCGLHSQRDGTQHRVGLLRKPIESVSAKGKLCLRRLHCYEHTFYFSFFSLRISFYINKDIMHQKSVFSYYLQVY